MASWMIHLRVAQAISESFALTHLPAFILGNIAPDSGIPDERNDGFIPPAEVSHFKETDAQGIKEIHEERYIARYLTPERIESYSEKELSFHFGYLTHLITDKIWVREIVYPSKELFSNLYERNRAQFWHMVKKDWYDLDFLFLKRHPDFQAYRIYQYTPDLLNVYLPFFSADAFANRRETIVDFYRQGVACTEERETYLTSDDLDVLVEKAASEILAQCRPYISRLYS